MICFWLNDALQLQPENPEERNALVVIHDALLAGLKPNARLRGPFCPPHDNDPSEEERIIQSLEGSKSKPACA